MAKAAYTHIHTGVRGQCFGHMLRPGPCRRVVLRVWTSQQSDMYNFDDRQTLARNRRHVLPLGLAAHFRPTPEPTFSMYSLHSTRPEQGVRKGTAQRTKITVYSTAGLQTLLNRCITTSSKSLAEGILSPPFP